MIGVALAGIGGLIGGVALLADAEIGASWNAALRGLRSQLPTTGPASLVMLVCAGGNLLLGASLMRALRGVPFASWAEAAVRGLAGAVVLDLLLLGLLGPVGALTRPVLIAVHVVLLPVLLVWRRPLVLRENAASHAFSMAWWALVAVVWIAPVVVMLSSPVVAIQDVLPNHVAPAEYIRVYGTYESLDTIPAPNYGPSRHLLGYVGLMGILSELTGAEASLAASTFVLPLAILVAAGGLYFVSSVLDAKASRWILIALPLTFSFVRLPDARGSVLAAPLALAALMPEALPPRRRSVSAAMALAALTYLHPLLGAFAFLSYATLAAWRQYRGSEDLPIAALGGALVLAIPQLLTMAGVGLPSWVLPIAAALGLAVAWQAAELRLRLVPILAFIAFVLAGMSLWRFGEIVRRTWDFVSAYPVLTFGFVAFLVVAGVGRRERSALVVPVLVALACTITAIFFPADAGFWQGIRDEVTGKTAQYWIPLFLAAGTAALLATLWHRERWVFLGRLAVVALLAFMALPLRVGETEFFDNEERRLSEQLSIALDRAERGAWVNWPDQRRVVDAPSRELIEAVSREQRAGRLGPRDRLLKVAADYQSWASTPVAPFTGAIVTSISTNPDRSPHAIGGRLRPLSALDGLLDENYQYVLLEPQDLASGVRREILRAGYSSVFVNDRGELFARAG